MLKLEPIPTDEPGLRQHLHGLVDRLGKTQLELLNRIAAQIELERLADELVEGITEDWRTGKLTEENIKEAIAEHRRRHPYR